MSGQIYSKILYYFIQAFYYFATVFNCLNRFSYLAVISKSCVFLFCVTHITSDILYFNGAWWKACFLWGHLIKLLLFGFLSLSLTEKSHHCLFVPFCLTLSLPDFILETQKLRFINLISEVLCYTVSLLMGSKITDNS